MRTTSLALLIATFATFASFACTRAAPGIQGDPQAMSPTQAPSIAAPIQSSVASPAVTAQASAGTGAPAAPPYELDTQGPATPPSQKAAPTARDQDAVREATFRYLMTNNASAQSKGADLYCLAIEDNKDPSAAFLAHFSNVHSLIRPVSACDASPDKGVVDKVTGKTGLIFRIESMSFSDDNHVDVGGGYYEAGLSASGNTYSLERKNGVWHVVKDVMHWIS